MARPGTHGQSRIGAPIEYILGLTDTRQVGGDSRKIDVYAARQYGVFNVRQARDAGFDKSAVMRRCASGEWIRLCPNVFAVASAPPKWERSVAASVLSRPKAIVGGLSAAYLHGLDGGVRGRPEIVVPGEGNARSPIARVTRHANFHQLETVVTAGFTATSVEETMILLSRRLSAAKLAAAFDAALISGKMVLGVLDGALMRERASCAPGMAAIRELAESRSPVAPTTDGSYLERLTEMIFRRGGVTGWSREFPLSVRGRDSRVDFCFSEWQVIVEADSRSWHMRAADFESDRHRDNQLTAQGFAVVRFTFAMLDQEPDRCLAILSKVIAERRATGGAERDLVHTARFPAA